MSDHQASRQLHAVNDHEGRSCEALTQQPGINNFLVCSRPVHSPGTDHICVGDDGSVLGSWQTAPLKNPAEIATADYVCAS